jgi:ketosteroid isomerase-like protein
MSIWASAAAAQDLPHAQGQASLRPQDAVSPKPVEEPAPRDARATLLAWADAWSRQDPDQYLSFYARSFQPPKATSRTAWEAARRERISKPRFIEVEVANIVIVVYRDHTAATFLQTYQSDTFRDRVAKRVELIWEQGNGRFEWKIRDERVVEAEPVTEKN